MSALGEPRAFDPGRDLLRIVESFRVAHADPVAPDYQHPGGMEWWLRRIAKDDFRVHVWDDGPALRAFAIDDDGYVIPRTADRRVASRMAVIAWMERAFAAAGRDSIELAAADDERELRDALASRGYVASGSHGDELVYDINGEPSRPDVAPGYRIVTLADLDDDAYVELHRAAWSTIKPSDYTRALHDIVTAMPDFRRDMVPVVVSADGALAASCIGWFDAASRSVEIEPLGTHPDHLRRGLARAIVREVHRRAWERGARSVMVWGSHSNAAASALYRSAGMTPRRIVRDYRLAL